MPKNLISSKFLLILLLFLPFVFCGKNIYAESNAFSGVTTSITPDKSCKAKPATSEITIVFDGEPESASNGWIYGERTSAAEFKRISPTQFEVTYAANLHHKQLPAIMEMQSSSYGYNAIIHGHIPENKEILEYNCYYKIIRFNLKPLNEQTIDLKTRGKELFAVELIILETSDLLWNQNNSKLALERGQKALPLYERNYGKWSNESLNATALIAFALIEQERFDEALEIVAPYRKELPNNDIIKKIEGAILILKKEQDELFRYDSNITSDIDLDPLG
jgi:hypothetical protein